MEFNELMQLCNELEEYSNLEGTEFGEVCNALILLANYYSILSEPLRKSVEEEIIANLNYFKENCVINTEETIPVKVRKLDWN